jgi:phosphatidylglycerophosphate synthase
MYECMYIHAGYIARKFDQRTVLGSFLDPFGDKVMVASVMIAMNQIQLLPDLLVGLVVGTFMDGCMHVFMCACMHASAYVDARMHVCLCVYMHVCVQVYKDGSIGAELYISIHTYIHVQLAFIHTGKDVLLVKAGCCYRYT